MKVNDVTTELLPSSKMQTPRHFFTSKLAAVFPRQLRMQVAAKMIFVMRQQNSASDRYVTDTYTTARPCEQLN